jgi:hypothetical protein
MAAKFVRATCSKVFSTVVFRFVRLCVFLYCLLHIAEVDVLDYQLFVSLNQHLGRRNEAVEMAVRKWLRM